MRSARTKRRLKDLSGEVARLRHMVPRPPDPEAEKKRADALIPYQYALQLLKGQSADVPEELREEVSEIVDRLRPYHKVLDQFERSLEERGIVPQGFREVIDSTPERLHSVLTILNDIGATSVVEQALENASLDATETPSPPRPTPAAPVQQPPQTPTPAAVAPSPAPPVAPAAAPTPTPATKPAQTPAASPAMPAPSTRLLPRLWD